MTRLLVLLALLGKDALAPYMRSTPVRTLRVSPAFEQPVIGH